MTESRTPPKFVPTLTEEAVQDGVQTSGGTDTGAAAAGAAARPAESLSSGVDVMRRRRLDLEGPVPGVWGQTTDDIADLPTYSGWAQTAAAWPLGSSVDELPAPAPPVQAVPVPVAAPIPVLPAESIFYATPWTEPAPEGDFYIDTDAHNQVGIPAAAAAFAQPAGTADVTSQLVESAAETAQALEDAITRRVTRRVQETLDARLSAAVLKVVEQQTALLQSSLQLEIDSTIREAVSDAVAGILREPQDRGR